MKQYRIIEQTLNNGDKQYLVQYRWFFFWLYVREVYDMSMYAYKVIFDKKEKAQDFIESAKSLEQSNINKKVAKTVVIK